MSVTWFISLAVAKCSLPTNLAATSAGIIRLPSAFLADHFVGYDFPWHGSHVNQEIESEALKDR